MSTRPSLGEPGPKPLVFRKRTHINQRMKTVAKHSASLAND